MPAKPLLNNFTALELDIIYYLGELGFTLREASRSLGVSEKHIKKSIARMKRICADYGFTE